MTPRLLVSCLCKASTQEVTPHASDGPERIDLALCHCDICRHSSGVLCTSYYPILKPVITDNLKVYDRAGTSIRRYFCSICGSPMFRSREISGDQIQWEVSSGVVTGSEGVEMQFAKHINVDDTKDGGASTWIGDLEISASQPSSATDASLQDPSRPSAKSSDDIAEVLPGSCACGTVRFHVTRPNDASYKATSAYPDLMYADKLYPEGIKRNAQNVSWWIGGSDSDKFLAGTCACQSCRLASGFEIQTWAFIPRANIFFYVQRDDTPTTPLDFEMLPEGILSSYSSSHGVTREFCNGCGATVFWRGDWRSELLDVSVGLFRADGGARAEKWLDWWTDRVSFEEETDTGRTGSVGKAARGLITDLRSGLKAWRGEKDGSYAV